MSETLNISQKAHDRIKEIFDTTFDDEDFILTAIEEEQSNMLSVLTNERLRTEGFPEGATQENVSHKYHVKNNIDLDMWVEIHVVSLGLEGASDYDLEKQADDDIAVLGTIMENFQYVTLELEILESVEEWKSQNVVMTYSEVVHNIQAVISSTPYNFIQYMMIVNPYTIDEAIRQSFAEKEGVEIYNISDLKEGVDYAITLIQNDNVFRVADIAYKRIKDKEFDLAQYLDSQTFFKDIDLQNAVTIDVDILLEGN
ncbi:hypothetical protein [Staphylococcus equorum]|uniref:Uncharacterized protein n=1 Tax=Staphylococcus equorum TaxID=246432 RepID=A0AAP7IF58_9STAP|nr:hypothetical protein [Staphylococcus equorum]OEK58869.1 hypothetical protein ASS94_00680 [Staphylococcus equorum]